MMKILQKYKYVCIRTLLKLLINNSIFYIIIKKLSHEIVKIRIEYIKKKKHIINKVNILFYYALSYIITNTTFDYSR